MNIHIKKGFTFVELLLVIGILIVLSTGIMLFMKPQEQIARSNDTRRRSDLNLLRNAFEEWYNDKGCYPTAKEACYNMVEDPSIPVGRFTRAYGTCHLCMTKPPLTSSDLSKYNVGSACDPSSPSRDYFYQVYGTNYNCPTSYYIFTKFSATYSKTTDVYGCGASNACGSPPTYGYSYYVSSPNAYAQTAVSADFTCVNPSTNKCVGCGGSEEVCLTVDESACDHKKIYVSYSVCVAANPTAR